MIHIADIQSPAPTTRTDTSNASHSLLSHTDSNLSMYTIFEDEKTCSSSLNSGTLKKRPKLSFRQKVSPSKRSTSKKIAVPVDGEKEMAKLKESFSKIGDIGTKEGDSAESSEAFQHSSDAVPDSITRTSSPTPSSKEQQGQPKLRKAIQHSSDAVPDSITRTSSEQHGQSCKPKLRKVAFVREDTPVIFCVSDLEKPKEIRVQAPSPVTSDRKLIEDTIKSPSPIPSSAEGSPEPKTAAPVMDTLATPAEENKAFYEHQRPNSAPTLPKHPSSLPLQKQDACMASLAVPNTPNAQRRLSSPLIGESPRETSASKSLQLFSPQQPHRSLSFQSAMMEKPPQLQRPKFLKLFPTSLSPTRQPLDQRSR